MCCGGCCEIMTCDVPEVFVSIKVILATSSTRRISSDVAFIFPPLPFAQVL
jgi:hypothetical protein